MTTHVKVLKPKSSAIKGHTLKVTLLTLSISFLSPSMAVAAPNDLTTVASASAAAAQLVGAGAGITVVGGTEAIFGTQVKSFTSINLGTISGNTYALPNPGIFLTSSTGRGANAASGSLALRTQMYNLWQSTPGAGTALLPTNVSSVSFSFTTNSPSTTSIAMNFLFLSNEQLPGPWDLGMVIVDGVNYAFLPGNKLLRVSPESNLNNLGVAGPLNGDTVRSGATAQSLVALLDTSLSTHTITIAVADTGDNSVASMMMVTAITAGSGSVGGVGVSTEEAGNTPIFAQRSSNESGYTVQITNYDPTFTYQVSTTLGAVSISPTGLITVSALRPDQTATVTVTTSRAGYTTVTTTVSGRAGVLPMIPSTKPELTIRDTLITCTIGSYSATPTSAAFSLFVDGRHISTNFSALGELLPDWIIPWATSSTITRTATLTSATWSLEEAYKGKAITCATLGYSKNAIGLTASVPLVAR